MAWTTFVDGTTAVAGEVNANFDSLVLHKVLYTDATERTHTGSTEWTDTATAFTLTVSGGCVLVGGTFRAQLRNEDAQTAGAQLKVTGSTITTTYARRDLRDNAGTGAQIDSVPYWATDTGSYFYGSFFVDNTAWKYVTWSIPYPLILPDDATTFTVQLCPSDAGTTAEIKNVTLELWYRGRYVDDDA